MTRSLLYVAALGMVCLVAIWAYQVIDSTRDLRREVDALHARIATERETLSVLRAEWAWLNRPARLARLAEAHRDTLRLVPMSPGHFAEVAAVAFQPPPPHAPGPAPEQAARPPGRDGPDPVLMGRGPAQGAGAPILAAATVAGGPIPEAIPEAIPESAPRRAVAGPSRGPVAPDLRAPPRAPALAAAEPQVSLARLAGNDWLALGLPLPPQRPARP